MKRLLHVLTQQTTFCIQRKHHNHILYAQSNYVFAM